jgi:thiol-disulfide isomerase/thioredoxin
MSAMQEQPRVIVYVKPGCTLCEPLMRTVEKVRNDVEFSLEKVDISQDAQLMSKYGHEVPVVLINGRKAFKGHITEPAFKKRLKKARELAHGNGEHLEDAVEAPPYVLPRTATALLLAATFAGFAYFVVQGVVEAREGNGKLAGKLLRIEDRRNAPVPFNLEALTGGKVSLDQFRDKTVFLNFWATWCPPCIEEMPSMLRLGERMKNDPNFVMLAVSADDTWDPVRKFFAKGSPPFTVLLDAKGEIAKQYGTTMFPETYIVENGRIVAFIEGPRDWDKWYAEEYLRSFR